jgi:ribosomal protein S18 acetylase RimI-like enzyme
MDIVSRANKSINKHLEQLDDDMSLQTTKTMSRATLQWCFDLMKRSTQEYYLDAKDIGGWDDDERMEELLLENMQFIVIENIGYAAFLFDMDIAYSDTKEFEIPIVYLYELHVESAFRSQGYGSRLIEAVHAIGRQLDLLQVTVTVFKRNTRAEKFYISRGYRIDSSCPSLHLEPMNTRRVSYKIYSYKFNNEEMHSSMNGS